MIKHLSKLKALGLMLGALYFPVQASSATQDTLDAQGWLKRLNHAVTQLNFDTSFVRVHDNKAEPYRWLHGRIGEMELENIITLNGPGRIVARRDNVTSFIESGVSPYSINGRHSGPIPAIKIGDLDELQRSYEFVLVGKNRIAGRHAQLLRIEPKDNHRYGIWLWLDWETGLMLKAAMVDQKGKVLEQLQFTQLQVMQQPAEQLVQLSTARLPALIDPQMFVQSSPSSRWKANWLPEGMHAVKSDNHRLAMSRENIDYMMFSDGLVKVSVYCRRLSKENAPTQMVKTGAITLFTTTNNGVEVTVVGKLPPETARQIALSVRPLS